MSETTTLSLTPAAAKRIRQITEGQKHALVRLEVLGGGCSGFQYKFGFADAAEGEDVVIERDGARLVIDTTSLGFLKGSEVDYGESLMEAGFRVKNPNAASSCGCGSSFAV